GNCADCIANATSQLQSNNATDAFAFIAQPYRTFSLRHDCVNGRTMKNHWLVKQEPEAYSWDDFVCDGKTDWTGVRNFLARKNLREMQRGDRVLFYHSVSDKAVIGIAEVSREAFPDPTAKEGDWSAVELKPVKRLKKPVTLAEIRAEPKLKNVALLRCARLSVQPLGKAEFDLICRM